MFAQNSSSSLLSPPPPPSSSKPRGLTKFFYGIWQLPLPPSHLFNDIRIENIVVQSEKAIYKPFVVFTSTSGCGNLLAISKRSSVFSGIFT